MYRFAKAIDSKSRDPRIPLLLSAQLVRDDKQRDREDQPVEEAAPENKPLILHFSFPPFQHFQHVLPKTDDYIRITYTKFALESHRYFSCSKTSRRTEAPRFPLFRIAENPLTNYPRGGIIILYGNVYGNGNGNERHRQQTCVKTNVKSAPAPPGRAEHSLPRQSDG